MWLPETRQLLDDFDNRFWGGPGDDDISGGPGRDDLSGDDGQDLIDSDPTDVIGIP